MSTPDWLIKVCDAVRSSGATPQYNTTTPCGCSLPDPAKTELSGGVRVTKICQHGTSFMRVNDPRSQHWTPEVAWDILLERMKKS